MFVLSASLELDYLKMVKQTFGVPGSQGNHYLVVKNPSLIAEEQNKNSSIPETESTLTAYSLTILVVSVIGIILLLVITYFCYSATSSVVCYMMRHRKKKDHYQGKYMEANAETETSSLESVEVE